MYLGFYRGFFIYFYRFMQSINIQGEELQLLAEKAIYWPATETLIASDLHWGKTGHFRKNGVAIPAAAQHSDETLLSQLLEKTSAKRLIVAGDFFHSRENNETISFKHWREAHSSIEIVLVMGNHDMLPKERYAEWGVSVYDELMDVGPFIISHDVIEDAPKFYMHGHIHPSCLVKGKTRFAVKLPCFCIDDRRLVLPAFGSFTGTKKIHQPDYNHIYVIAEDAVIHWK